MALPRKDLPVVESLGLISQVILADPGSLIAARLQPLCERVLPCIKVRMRVILVAVQVTVLARQQGGPAGTATRIGHVSLPDKYAFHGNAVHVRRLDRTIGG